MARKPKFDEDEEPIEIIYVSKSEIKRDAKALRDLGEQLVNMTPTQRSKLNLDEQLLDAIATAIKIANTREGYRRQLNYIGKMLRHRDEEAILAAIGKAGNANKSAERELQVLESIRTELLGENGNDKINQLVGEHPDFERQKLRQLIKKTKNQQTKQPEQPSPAFKELFQYLKEVIEP